MMIEYSKEYPGYAFEKNKGYGTKAYIMKVWILTGYVQYTERLF